MLPEGSTAISKPPDLKTLKLESSKEEDEKEPIFQSKEVLLACWKYLELGEREEDGEILSFHQLGGYHQQKAYLKECSSILTDHI